MHPAFSILFFTTLTGMAQGLVVVLAFAVLGGVPVAPGFLRAGLLIAGLLLVAGLGASFLHLGRKLKAVRLQLGPALAIVADLEIRLLRPFRSFLLGEQVQVGCSIDNIEMQMQQTLERLVTSNRPRQRN